LPNLDSVNHCTSKEISMEIKRYLLVQWLTESRSRQKEMYKVAGGEYTKRCGKFFSTRKVFISRDNTNYFNTRFCILGRTVCLHTLCMVVCVFLCCKSGHPGQIFQKCDPQ
jgi:hypothetical protein